MRIETKNVSINIGKALIIDDISVTIENKKFVGIIGPNGSGKSTLLKSIYRVLSVSKGSVYIDDTNIKDMSIKESAKKLGVMTQITGFSFDFTVLEVVMMGRTPHKRMMESDKDADYEIAYGAIQRVGMSDFMERKFNSLSGGERQRVLIARALTSEPRALILDEPTNHLDIQYQISLMEVMKNLGIEVFAAIHDLNLAATYCDWIYVINKGHIVMQGTPKDLFTEKMIFDIFHVKSKIIKVGDIMHIIYTGV